MHLMTKQVSIAIQLELENNLVSLHAMLRTEHIWTVLKSFHAFNYPVKQVAFTDFSSHETKL